MKNLMKIINIIITFMVAVISAQASTPSTKIVPPDGLRECDAGDPIRTSLAIASTEMGTAFLACFRSEDKVKISSENNSIDTPRDYAYALLLKGSNEYHFSRNEFDNLESKIKKQWEKYTPLNAFPSKEYQEKIDSIIGRLVDSVKLPNPDVKLELNAPLLVNFDQSVDGQYIVTSIRKRTLQVGTKSFVTVKVETAALIYKDEKIMRLSFARELRNNGDVDHVMDISKAWLSNIRNTNLELP